MDNSVLTIIVSVIGLISTVFGIFGISAYTSEKAKNKAKKDIAQDEREFELEKAEAHRELVNTIKEVVKEEIDPVKKDLSDIKEDLAADKTATITSTRATMKQLRDHYKTQGYADIGDKATWNELYENYRKMGGNFFKLYVSSWRDEVNALPNEPLFEDLDNEEN